jgi:ferredoxin
VTTGRDAEKGGVERRTIESDSSDIGTLQNGGLELTAPNRGRQTGVTPGGSSRPDVLDFRNSPFGRSIKKMKVWIDQDLCTGDGLCEEIAPDVFVLLDDGLAYVREGATIYAEANGNSQGAAGVAVVPAGQEDITIESAEECPGECIFLEP